MQAIKVHLSMTVQPPSVTILLDPILFKEVRTHKTRKKKHKFSLLFSFWTNAIIKVWSTDDNGSSGSHPQLHFSGKEIIFSRQLGSTGPSTSIQRWASARTSGWVPASLGLHNEKLSQKTISFNQIYMQISLVVLEPNPGMSMWGNYHWSTWQVFGV